MTNLDLVVINPQKETHEFSKWKHIPVNKDTFFMVVSNCNPSFVQRFRATESHPLKIQQSENMMFPNPDTLTCVSSLLMEFLLFPTKVNAGKIKCLRGRHRVVETYILNLMEL